MAAVSARDGGDEPREKVVLDRQRSVGRRSNLGFEVSELHGREPHGPGHGLAMDEQRIVGRLPPPLADRRRDLDEEAEEIVVLDLEGADLRGLGVAGLEPGHDPAGVVAQLARFVEREIVAGPDEAAVAREKRQVLAECGSEAQAERGIDPARGACGVGEVRRQIGLFEQPGRERGGGREAVAQRREVAWAAAPEAQPRQGARHVGGPLQHGPDLAAPPPILDPEGDRVEPLSDRDRIGQRAGEPLGEQPAAARRHGRVDRVEQRAYPLAAERAGHLEVGPGRSVDLDRLAAFGPDGRPQGRASLELGPVDIRDGEGRGRDLGPRETAEAVERLDAVPGAEASLGRCRLAHIARHAGDGGAAVLQDRAQRDFFGQGIGHDDLARFEPRQQGREPGLGCLGQREGAGREFDGRDPVETVRVVEPDARQGHEQVRPDGLEQALFRDGAGRDDAHHGAAHDRLAAALAGFRWILGLFADRDRVARRDQRVQVVVRPLHRHAAHGDVLALMLAALGQDDAEHLGRNGRILEEELVEIAHAVEQQGIGMVGLDAEILRHHGRDAVGLRGRRAARRLGRLRGGRDCRG